MIAPQDSSAEVMKKALSFTLATLVAAGEFDLDLGDDDRAFLRAEHDGLSPVFDRLVAATTAAEKHQLTVGVRAQARVVLGDAVLDRNVRDAKARMKLELKGTAMPDGADHVFPKNVRDLIDAEMRSEPDLVLNAVERFAQVPTFGGAPHMRDGLVARATQQKANFASRDESDRTASALDGALRLAIREGSDALYRIEKRLLDRFPREGAYVRSFFLDAAAPRASKATRPGVAPPPVGTPAPA